METKNILVEFFKKSYEKKINNQMFFYDFCFPTDEVKNYIKQINSVPYIRFIEYIVEDNHDYHISSRDVVQFSSIADATVNICIKMLLSGDKGLRYDDIGKMLLDDGNQRKQGALKKYGENHSKTAEELGLTQFKSYYCFLTAVGRIYPSLESVDQRKLLSRLALRNNLMQKIIREASRGNVDLKGTISFLSESTVKRRIPNVKKMLSLILDNNELSLSDYKRKIIL